jgi:hypothetical protein
MKRHWKIALVSVVAVVAVAGIVYSNRSTYVDLRQNSAIRKVHIQFDWTKLDGNQQYTYEIACPNEKTCSTIGQKASYDRWNDKQYTTALASKPVPYELVVALDAALVNLIQDSPPYASVSPEECGLSTDDYPKFEVAITYGAGQLAELTSWCNSRIPWVVNLNGTTYTQKTGDIPQAYQKLVVSIDPYSGY